MSSSTERISISEQQPAQSIWGAVREALAGAHGRDFTEGPIGRAIFILAVPMVLEMMMESIFVVVDVFVVAHLGADAVATVGLTESFMTILYTLAMGLSIGAGAMVSRRIGEKDTEGAAHTAAQVILFGLGLALVIGALGAYWARDLLRVMGASEGVIQNVSFTRVMVGGNASVVLLFLINSVFRSSGDAATAMRTLWLANAINIVLGPALVFGWGPLPRLGIVGAAIGTTIGRGTGVLYALTRLRKRESRVRLQAHHFGLDLALIGRVVRLSSAATFQVFVGMASWIGLVRILASFGSAALAGYTIGMRVVMFALLPSFGMSNAAATMVGQALGAKKPERAETAVWKTARYNAVFLGVIGLSFVIFARQIVGGFTQDPEIARYGILTLRTVAYGFVFYAYGMVIGNSFNGAGDTRTPTRINLFVFWLLEIPLAWVLSHQLGMGPFGVFVAMTIAFSTLAVVSAVLFRRGRWKVVRV
ncbi:MAG TPA: MATE family efflux transporter [Gemmatimonadaceae bacterium]|jgi:putative MATE family efflux protein|nr:MATE family efflux transporter [Gemmatimonadaceae bacterium]